MQLFVDLNAEGITVVVVTHEPDIAMFAKRLVRFVDGKVVHDGAVSRQLVEAQQA
jgi:putative ABC transport system ATP-binding protein